MKKISGNSSSKHARIALVILTFVALFAVTVPTAASGQEPSESPRIIGGVPIQNGEFPFLVGVLNNGGGWCGGSLIGSEWVLTAAHCLDNVSASTISIGLGDRDQTAFPQEIQAAELIPHPNFSYVAIDTNDIALIRLATPADTAPVTVGLGAPNVDAAVPAVGSATITMGWGDTTPGAGQTNYPDVARKATVNVQSCDGRYYDERDASSVCASGPGTDACFGDSGGPLVQMTASGGWTIVATVESGPPSYSCGISGTYGIYQRVSPHIDWIESVTGLDFGGTSAEVCQGLPVSIDMNTNGGNGLGTPGDDVILGTPGPDVIDARGGNDTICAGDGDDDVRGGPGIDYIEGEGGADTVNAGGDDDIVRGGAGDDDLRGGPGNDEIDGGEDNDLIRGDSDVDILLGRSGNDTVRGGPGDDDLAGGAGADFLTGGPGSDFIDGGIANDDIFGQLGDDFLVGGPGDDHLRGGAGSDGIDGEDGADRLDGNGGDDVLYGAAGNDDLNGTDGDDVMFGEDGDDDLSGGNGNDTLFGGPGVDVCRGNLDLDYAEAGTCETLSAETAF